MSGVLDALGRTAWQGRPALLGRQSLTYAALHDEASAFAQWLRERQVSRLALRADNGPGWVVADLACLAAGTALVPLPGFFTAEQLSHSLQAAAVDHLLFAPPAPPGLPDNAGRTYRLRLAGEEMACVRIAPPVPADCAKITFTSGTTGRPKGVRLSADVQQAVAVSIARALNGLGLERHMAVLPLATLLENVAGVYVPLLLGATVQLPPSPELGHDGASGFDLSRLVAAVGRYRPESLILVPQLLHALVSAAEAGIRFPETLRFVAVGGGRVAGTLLARARDGGLPVYEGYGLSECGSVVTLNLPGADRPGSAGRPLAHARLEVAADGEILVHGPSFLGYTGDADMRAPGPAATGDLGHVDDNGYLHVTGRKKNVFITAFGRNVSPEWIEAELTAENGVVQAAAFGEARPWNAAVIVSAADDRSVDRAVKRANARLPDYARVRRWLRAGTPFTAANGQLTPNGRVRRAAVWEAYRAPLLDLYR